LFAPKSPLEALLQRLRLLLQFPGPFRVSEHGGELGRPTAGGVDVALYFTQGDGALRQAAVGMEDRIVRIFPALMHKSFGRMTEVLDKAISITVAVAVDPLQGELEVRPDRLDELPVSRSLKVSTGQKHEQGGGVHTAVVPAEGNLAQGGHLAAARFV